MPVPDRVPEPLARSARIGSPRRPGRPTAAADGDAKGHPLAAPFPATTGETQPSLVDQDFNTFSEMPNPSEFDLDSFLNQFVDPVNGNIMQGTPAAGRLDDLPEIAPSTAPNETRRTPQ